MLDFVLLLPIRALLDLQAVYLSNLHFKQEHPKYIFPSLSFYDIVDLNFFLIYYFINQH